MAQNSRASFKKVTESLHEENSFLPALTLLVFGSLAITAYAFSTDFPKIATLGVVYVGLALLVGLFEQFMPHSRY